MSIYTPYSKLATSPIPINSTNFPCLKHFWQCSQSDITNKYLADAVGTVNLNAAGIAAGTDSYSVAPNQAASGSTKSGTITPPNGKQFMLFSVGKFGANGFTLGDTSSGPGINLNQGASNSVAAASGKLYPGTAMTNSSSIYGRALIVTNYNSATGMQTLQCDTSATYTAETATTTANDSLASGVALSADNLASLEGASNKWACSATVTSLYGAALFIFANGLPSDYRSAIAWMTYQWSIGNKVIYPGWYSIA